MNPLDALIPAITALSSHGLAAPYLLGYLVLAIAVDFSLGTLAAWRMGILNSSMGRKGTTQKAAMLLGALFFVGFENLFAATGIPVAAMVIGAFLIHEIQSVVENLGRCGIDLPQPVVNALAKVQESQAFYQARREASDQARPTAEIPTTVKTETNVEIATLVDQIKTEQPNLFKLLVAEGVKRAVAEKQAAHDAERSRLDAPSFDAPSNPEPVKIRRVLKSGRDRTV